MRQEKRKKEVYDRRFAFILSDRYGCAVMATEWLNSFCSNVVVVGFAAYERENEKKKRKDNSLLIYSDARDRKSL